MATNGISVRRRQRKSSLRQKCAQKKHRKSKRESESEWDGKVDDVWKNCV